MLEKRRLFARMPAQLELGRAAVDRADEAGTARAAQALLEEIGMTAARAEALGDTVHVGLGEARGRSLVRPLLVRRPCLVLEPQGADVAAAAEIVGQGRNGRDGQDEQRCQKPLHVWLPGKG